MLIGKELGLSGIELKNFCENERKLDLETKSLERDENKAQGTRNTKV